jgi:hypothetical protein
MPLLLVRGFSSITLIRNISAIGLYQKSASLRAYSTRMVLFKAAAEKIYGVIRLSQSLRDSFAFVFAISAFCVPSMLAHLIKLNFVDVKILTVSIIVSISSLGISVAW